MRGEFQSTTIMTEIYTIHSPSINSVSFDIIFYEWVKDEPGQIKMAIPLLLCEIIEIEGEESMKQNMKIKNTFHLWFKTKYEYITTNFI